MCLIMILYSEILRYRSPKSEWATRNSSGRFCMDTVKAAASFLHFSSAQLVCVAALIESVWPKGSFADIPRSNFTVKHRYPNLPEAYRNCTEYRLPLRLGSVGCVDGVLSITGGVSVKCAPVCPFSVGICVSKAFGLCRASLCSFAVT